MHSGLSEKRSDRLAKFLFVVSCLGGTWISGIAVAHYELFPYTQIRFAVGQARSALGVLGETVGTRRPLYYYEMQNIPDDAVIHAAEKAAPGNTLISGISTEDQQVVRIIDEAGDILHEWRIDWFDIWPEPAHLDEDLVPKSRPGASIHGIVFMPNGDLVFNFENLGLVRLDYCGAVVWRLPYRTHHSIQLDENGNLWVPGKVRHLDPSPRFPNHKPPFDDFLLLEVSPDGDVLTEISVFELLIDNGLSGLLYLSTVNNWGTVVSGDTLHLNDLDIFPSTISSDVFSPGDFMISLRNINAIFVFDKESRRVKFQSIGNVIRQHDPDFVDGNKIAVLDNHNLSSAVTEYRRAEEGLASRIVLLDVSSGELSVVFSGSEETPFFTDIMGKQQWLDNGNILIAEARHGRAFEVTRDGAVVWEYYNRAGPGLLGLIDDAQRLPLEFDREMLDQFALACQADL